MKSMKLNFILVPLIGLMLSACGKDSTAKPSPAIIGRYEQALGDGSIDILIVREDRSMSLELTRQVGGPGGISNDGVVPYPTVCRVKQLGAIISEDTNNIQYEVNLVELADLTGLRDTEHCTEYVRAFNAIIRTQGGVGFTLKKSEYVVVK